MSKRSNSDKTSSARRKASKNSGHRGVFFYSITLENVRCFGSKQTLRLFDRENKPAQWTVILGDNGIGKTTVLQCLASMQPVEFGFRRGDQPEIFPRYSREGYPEGILEILRFDSTEPAIATAEIALNSTVGQSKTRAQSKFATLEFQQLSQNSYSAGRNGPDKNPEQLLDLVCYAYGANRRSGDTSLSQNRNSKSSASLFSDDFELRNPEEWLLQADYAAIKESKNKGRAKDRLRKAREILIDLLPDVDDIRFSEPQKKSNSPQVEFHTPFGWVSFRDLGLGYRTLIAWMVDFASQLFERYPESEEPLAEPAVCLVDEIDLHLHPNWQQQIMGYLSRHFPATQFIVTAHSPIFVQAAAGTNIAVLRRNGDEVVIDQSFQGIQGWRLDQVLTSDLFGFESARPPEFDELISQRRRLLTKTRLTKAEMGKLSKLNEQMHALPAGESLEDQEAMDLIRKAARRLKRTDN